MIYIVVPIYIYIFNGTHNFISYIPYFVLGAVLYSVYTTNKENRLNVSGISSMVLIIICIYFSENYQGEYSIYIYRTYIMCFLSGTILLFSLMNKNICSQIYTDILNMKLNNQYSSNVIRKKKLENE
ncbi:MAG: hypothetical protein ACRDD7_00740, partial [Peptostreptococcaceae bacterium]